MSEGEGEGKVSLIFLGQLHKQFLKFNHNISPKIMVSDRGRVIVTDIVIRVQVVK